ncbi:unnamed protein product [Rotaria sp. Silwood2]|nr:unnamed protein product [Rotaria sp. Silwood2]CAF2607448.1 unnamed protein product [Rotaria sp. Silwood2]CAF3021443.1 unnamed protein product [Rotaria sp. Silwood2]CAF3946510.1 unnamed protein product [Rotaria sp. Silwood2]CAF4087777.1 unnamed protein product [Rotaria sp. Silwood2]
MASFDFKKYLGSGVLIVDAERSSLLLVHDYTQNYNCCGGFIKYDYDDPQRIEKTAIEELYEETRTLLSCDIDHLRTCSFVDLNFHDDIFRCYIFKTRCKSDICEQFENYKSEELPVDDDYHETTSIAFFPLRQFRRKRSLLKIDGNSMAKDSNGKLNPLNRRVISLNADIDEIKNLLSQSNRSRVKQFLEIQQRRLETDLITLKEKQEQNAAPAAEKKPTVTVPSSTNRSYTKEITLYAWDQTDKYVKIYVQNLDGVGDLPENQVRSSFEVRGFTLEIINLKNINYLFKRGRLLNEIKPEQSSYKVKKDMVIISLAKADSKNWECIFQDEKKTPEKPIPKMDDGKDPGDSLMQLMKNMYETGDDEMKRTIAKAWTESREKMNTGGGGGGGSEMPEF